MPQSTICRGSATAVYEKDNVLRVIYHNTEVVKLDRDTGTITLDTGGYKTVTTKRRMNQAAYQFDLAFTVFQKDHKWFVNWKGENIPFTADIMELTV